MKCTNCIYYIRTGNCFILCKLGGGIAEALHPTLYRARRIPPVLPTLCCSSGQPGTGDIRCDCLGEPLSTLHPSWDPAGSREIAQGQVQQAVHSSNSQSKCWGLEAFQVIDKRSQHINNQEVCSLISCLFILIFAFHRHCNLSDRDPASMNRSLPLMHSHVNNEHRGS